jgi:hypothetical protein
VFDRKDVLIPPSIVKAVRRNVQGSRTPARIIFPPHELQGVASMTGGSGDLKLKLLLALRAEAGTSKSTDVV